MAGNYPDVPGPRMAYDRDGTVVMRVDHTGGTSAALSAGSIAVINDEDADTYSIHGTGAGARDLALCFIFPEQRDIAGYLLHVAGNIPAGLAMWWSNDTTTGLDGVWTSVGTAVRALVSGSGDFNKEALRTNPPMTALAVPNIKAFRYRGSYVNSASSALYFALHLFGSITAGANPNSLRLWHATLDQPLGGAALDFGDVPQGSTSIKQFRVKNNSSTLTANTITLALEAPSDASPSLTAQHDLSLDGTTYASTRTITSLAPGAISGVCHLRRQTASAAGLAIWLFRVNIDAATWT